MLSVFLINEGPKDPEFFFSGFALLAKYGAESRAKLLIAG